MSQNYFVFNWQHVGDEIFQTYVHLPASDWQAISVLCNTIVCKMLIALLHEPELRIEINK